MKAHAGAVGKAHANAKEHFVAQQVLNLLLLNDIMYMKIGGKNKTLLLPPVMDCRWWL